MYGGLLSGRKKILSWLREYSQSSRLTFILQIVSRLGTNLLNLIWTPLLLSAMGKSLNGVFMTFQSVAQLGGLGDLGMGGAVNIRALQYLGQGKNEELVKFLSTARTVFVCLALSSVAFFLVFHNHLPGWMGFVPTENAGSLPTLFMFGGLSIGFLILNSYFSNLNYACGNISWPILPGFLFLQFALACHWWLASHKSPLWMQSLPYIVIGLCGVLVNWFCVRANRRDVSGLFPLKFNWRIAVSLFESSFWMYLYSLGNAIYTTTDNLIVNAGFGSAQVPAFKYNRRLCEMGTMLIVTASFATLPKIAQWMASPDGETNNRARSAADRLNKFQTFCGLIAALAYLALNNIFMRVWLHGEDMVAPFFWQAAFALNLVVTTSGDTCIQLTARCGSNGLRVAGAAIGLTGLLNLGFAVGAMKMGSINGVSLAPCIAQTVLNLASSWYTCRYLKMNWSPWVWKGWLCPILAVGLAIWLRHVIPLDSALHVAMLCASYLVILLISAFWLGVDAAFIRDEITIFKNGFKKK